MWTTLEGGVGVVQFSTDKSYSRSVNATPRAFTPTQTGMVAAFTQYEAALTGLTANTDYFFRVMVDGTNVTPADELHFHTAGADPYFFLVVGDTGQATTQQLQVANAMSLQFPISGGPDPAFILHTGDIAYYEGTFDQFESRYFPYYRNMMKRTPFFPVPGNHEYVAAGALPYLAVHSVPASSVVTAERGRYYSFDWGNVHYVALDSNDSLFKAANGTGKMFEWLEADLAKSTAFWKVAYWHHPPYATGPNSSDPGQAVLFGLIKDKVLPILERYDVQLVLNGHEHSYQRSVPIRAGQQVDPNDGIVYITSGGGGAGLYPVYPRDAVAFGESVNHFLRIDVQSARMTVRAVGVDGSLIEPSLILTPKPVITADSTVNAASFAPALAPGSLVSVFGRFLALNQTTAAVFPIPQTLGSAQVTLNGRRLPLLFVSRTQINTQLPFDMVGPAMLRVTTPNGFSEAAVTIAPTAPGIFFANQKPVLVHADNITLVSDTAPANPGETIVAYMTGLGAVSGPIVEGQAAPKTPLTVTAPVMAQVGGVAVQPSFAGLTPGFAGLYQVNLQIPSQLPNGAQPLQIIVGGTNSNAAIVPVRSSVPPQP